MVLSDDIIEILKGLKIGRVILPDRQDAIVRKMEFNENSVVLHLLFLSGVTDIHAFSTDRICGIDYSAELNDVIIYLDNMEKKYEFWG